MNKLHYILASLMVFLLGTHWVHGANAAKPALPVSAKQVLATYHPNYEELLALDFGDFTGDKIDDIAVILVYTEEGEHYEQLFLLQAVKPNVYALAAKSHEWQQVVRQDASVSIKRGSVYLNVASHDVSAYYVTKYQFKGSESHFYLIGADYEHGLIGEDKASDGKSINFLTNKQVVWNMANNKRKDKQAPLKQQYKKIELNDFGLDEPEAQFL